MQNCKVDKALIILNLFLVALIILGFGSLIDKNRQLKEDFYSSQLKCLELTIENEKLREQLENITVEELLGVPEDWKVIAVIATAYAPLDNKSGICADENPNMTAVGAKPEPGVIAVNPELIPYYSRMIIIGDGWIMEGQALDTGAKMRKEVYWIDILMESYEEAKKFGVRPAIVFFKEE